MDIDIKKLNQRRWKPAITPKGKLYCGYAQKLNIYTGLNKYEDVDEPHQVHRLSLSYSGTGRGRSSVVMYFTDPDGHTYEMTTKGFGDLTERLMSGRIKPVDNMIEVDVIQVKQGQNYAIELV